MNSEKQKKNSVRRKGRWRGFAKPWNLLIIAAIVFTVLYLTGCASSKKAERQRAEVRTETLDSLLEETHLKLSVPIPEERAELPVSLADLHRLPEGAGFHTRNGRASAAVSREGDTIRIYATCDSLQARLELYEKKYRESKRDNEELREEVRKEKERRPNTLLTAALAFIIGAGTGISFNQIKKK